MLCVQGGTVNFIAISRRLLHHNHPPIPQLQYGVHHYIRWNGWTNKVETMRLQAPSSSNFELKPALTYTTLGRPLHHQSVGTGACPQERKC
ncbi:unnamed protein product [Nesidiocoris tenuis]|uniref:Uncharacterized protein n=1 Tax=Nesidiocoris tenuis TaxID=355587 RepID=A0A6H5HSN5_9HEMI|nr:unnamed protein product [Nesidiocoris tenuis]